MAEQWTSRSTGSWSDERSLMLVTSMARGSLTKAISSTSGFLDWV